MTEIRLRRGTASEWTTANPILAEGEVGIELDTKRFKVGNGAAYWSTLEYVLPESDVQDLIFNLAALKEHADNHTVGASDPILLSNLDSGDSLVGQIPVSDGVGGIFWDTASGGPGVQ